MYADLRVLKYVLTKRLGQPCIHVYVAVKRGARDQCSCMSLMNGSASSVAVRCCAVATTASAPAASLARHALA